MSADPKHEFFKIPFNAYDIFGYLIPGSFFMIVAFFFDKQLEINHKCAFLPVAHILKIEPPEKMNGFLVDAILLIILVIFAYVLGHIIASGSSYLLDKTLINRGHGYPYQKLLQIDEQRIYVTRIGRFVRGLFFWFNTYLLVQYVSWTFHIEYTNLAATIMIWWVILFFILSVILYPLIKERTKKSEDEILNKISIAWVRKLVRWVAHTKFWFHIVKSYNWLLNKIRWIYDLIVKYPWAGFYDLLNGMYAYMAKTRHPFDDNMIQKFKYHFETVFGYQAEKAGTNNYWFAVMYVNERSRNLSQTVQNFLSLYSFARNLSASLFLLFLYMFFMFIFNHEVLNTIQKSRLIFAPLLAYAGYIIVLSRYYYLYKNYYSKYVLRSFVFLRELETMNNNSKDFERKVEL